MSTVGGDTPFPYVAPLIAAERAGRGTGHMHLGLWDTRPDRVTREGWHAAQDRLTALMLDLADLADGQHIADIACGLGGTLRAIQDRVTPARLAAVNIDPVQLAHCPDTAERIEACATALPFAPASIDRAICLEAAFHFDDRRAFLFGIANALRPGGLLVMADVLLNPTPLTDRERDRCAALLTRDFGAWPDPWVTPKTLCAMAGDAGLILDAHHDLTAQTLPSYAVIAPGPVEGPPQSGAEVLRLLHRTGILHYGAFVWRKPH